MFLLGNIVALVLSPLILVNNGLVCLAFTTPQHSYAAVAKVTRLLALPASFWEFPSVITSDNVINRADVPVEEAFQDTISFADGPVGVLAAAFGVFVVVAVGLKAVMGQMDTAIEKVLSDFEATMQRYYPKRWKEIEESSLEGLQGDARDIKLLQVMEELQQKEPEFMTRVADRAKNSQSTPSD
jgi:type IV secretory pathway VirB2 component (pilin)